MRRRAVIVLACGLALASSLRAANDLWLQDRAGYDQGVERARAAGKPLFVYFYTDWCQYCRELERELLASPQVRDYLQAIVVVRVNPEAGLPESKLADDYHVTGYPALFVLPAGGGPPRSIRRTVDGSGASRLQTPGEFVATLRSAARR